MVDPRHCEERSNPEYRSMCSWIASQARNDGTTIPRNDGTTIPRINGGKIINKI